MRDEGGGDLGWVVLEVLRFYLVPRFVRGVFRRLFPRLHKEEITMMTERLLYEKSFLFEAHNEKAFAKLRDNQFARTFQGLIHEPFANALDQQTGAEPIRVGLRRGRTMSCLSFADNGVGLTAANLEALHFIGRTSKREERESKIGRFGMGLVGAFNRRLGVRRVVITTTVCGQPARITLRCPEQGVPRWRMHILPGPVTGFAISFLFPVRLHQDVQQRAGHVLRGLSQPRGI